MFVTHEKYNKMTKLSKNQKSFKLLTKHNKKRNIKILSLKEQKKKKLIENKKLLLSDFKQGDIGNCGLISTLAAISQRPEFSDEIYPRMDPTADKTNPSQNIRFKMYCEGAQTEVTVDDALPFRNKTSLVYAKSASEDEISMASYFEKSFVKQACNSSYNRCVEIHPNFAFSSFSDCMTDFRNYEKEDLKKGVIDYIKHLIDSKSSVVIGIIPALHDILYGREPDKKIGHGYVVVDYNYERNALKLYDPLSGTNVCGSKKKKRLTEGSDENTESSWVNIAQLEKREVLINSLYSKDMHKPVFSYKKQIKPSDFDKESKVTIDVCRLSVKEESTFMVNLFLYSHEIEDYDLIVKTADKREKVNLEFELPETMHGYKNTLKGHPKTEVYQKFQLRPNTYVLSLKLKVRNLKNKKLNFLLKVGCVSKCIFEELNLSH